MLDWWIEWWRWLDPSRPFMSKIDSVFGPLPGPLIAEWGQSAKFIRVDGPGAYDPDTGVVTQTEKEFDVTVIVEQFKPQEAGGLYQDTDFSIFIDPAQIDDHYINTKDRFLIPFPGGDVEMKVISLTTYRGDDPVFYEVVARPQ